MFLLLSFAFLAGVVTILSPCILPILPIVLSGSVAGGKKRPWGIVTGFVLSFTFFTLFLSAIVRATGVSPDALRIVSVVVIGLFGVSLLIPRVQAWLEQAFSKISSRTAGAGQQQREGFGGGVLIGLSLGLIWTPCVGPILASVISLALSGAVSGTAVAITLAYSLGTALPMLAILYGGRALLQKVPWLLANSGKIQKAFGVLMILIALAIQFNYDRKFQTYILERFPQYGVGLTRFEDNASVKTELGRLQDSPSEVLEEKRGEPMNEFLKDLGNAPELIPGGVWFNADPLTLEGLRGKVVLVDFWTYSCINCIRTLPYLKSWHQKYADKGLVIIGVHTPEFEFEKNPRNVEKAIADFGLMYPIVQDNDFATWRAYRNRFWPAKYFIDKEGRIRWTHFGEGAYDESEEVIQTLLDETGAGVGEMPIENPAYQVTARTPELYLGSARIEYLASPEGVQQGEAWYSIPNDLPLHYFGYEGLWMLSEEYAAPNVGARLRLQFEAKNVFLVMRPKGDTPGRISVLLDGSNVSLENAGEDVRDGQVVVDEDRLYRLIELQKPGKHTLELQFSNDGVELYAFTFG